MSSAATKNSNDDSDVTGASSVAGESGVRDAGSTAAGKARRKDPLIGKTINGRFTILDVIARGGMGKVYRAEQSPLGRICAVKVLNPRYDGEEDPEFQKRFFLEAATAAKLSHANTVTIFDYGRDGDIFYIAMEYIQGRTLYRILRDDGVFHEARVANVLTQVARSLREAHQLGVIHRDMKPANVVVIDNSDDNESLKVLDFGLVKDTADDSEDLTQAGLFMGSPKYMAPEQILGNTVSPATDIYALGVVAFELLTGRVPFDEGASVKTLMAHVNDEPPSLYSVNPNVQVSPQMEAIIRRCMEKSADDRFQSMDELLRALTEVRGGGALTDSLRQAPMVSLQAVQAAANRRSPSWSGPLESGPVSLGPSSAHQRIPDAVTVPPGMPADPSGSLPVLTGAPRTTLPSPPIYQEEDPSSNGKRGLMVAAVLLALGGTAFFVLGRGSQADTKAPTPATTTTAVAETPATPTASPTATATADATAASPDATASADASAAAEDAAPRVVSIDSTPSGAIVRENGKVLCSATPCKITFKGETEAEGKRHKLSFLKDGYNPGSVVLSADATSASKKLRRATAVVRPSPPPSRPTATTTAPKSKPDYKDSPY